MTSRAMLFTALEARNGLGFFVGTARVCHARRRITMFRDTDMEERDFFDERRDTRKHSLQCPHCHQNGEYDLGWIIRTKKRQLPGRADERDRAKFAKARSYMVRVDDLVACKNMRCRKRFEVAGVQSVVFTDAVDRSAPGFDPENFGNR